MPLIPYTACPSCGSPVGVYDYPAVHEPLKIGAVFQVETYCVHCQSRFNVRLRKLAERDFEVVKDNINTPFREQPKDLMPIQVENKPQPKTLF